MTCEVSFVRTRELLLYKAAKSTAANNEKPQNGRERETLVLIRSFRRETFQQYIYIIFISSTVCVYLWICGYSIWSGRNCCIICVFHICDLVVIDAVSPHRNKGSSHGALGRRTVTTQPFKETRIKKYILKRTSFQIWKPWVYRVCQVTVRLQ